MISYFPDVNVWLALTDGGHRMAGAASGWLRTVPPHETLLVSRYTQMALLRLLTNVAVMGEKTLTVSSAWTAYERWTADIRVSFRQEPSGLSATFRDMMTPFGGQAASKWVGDCYLLAFALSAGATLVTFDRALARFAEEQGCSVLTPA